MKFEEISLVDNKNNEFNLNVKEAFKFLIDDKLILNKDGYIFERHRRSISKKKNGELIKHINYEEFLLDENLYGYEEYIKPIPRRISFESYLGEFPEKEAYKGCPIENNFGYEVSRLSNDYNNLKSIYAKVSKFKVTFEEILE